METTIRIDYGSHFLALLEDLSAEPHQDLNGLHFAVGELAVVAVDTRVVDVFDGMADHLQRLPLTHVGSAANYPAIRSSGWNTVNIDLRGWGRVGRWKRSGRHGSTDLV